MCVCARGSKSILHRESMVITIREHLESIDGTYMIERVCLLLLESTNRTYIIEREYGCYY